MLQQIKNLIYQKIVNNEDCDELTVYAFTNENINGYLKELELDSNKKVLTIGSSGDHFFNLLINGVSKIDLIDINPVSRIYIEIKKALMMIGNLEDYQKLLEFSFKNFNWNLELEKKSWDLIIRYANLEYKTVLRDIFDYYYKLQVIYQKKIKLLQIFTKDYYYDWEELLFYNAYLRSKQEFLKLKSKLKDIQVSSYVGDIFQFMMQDNYDLVLASNALEYTINHSLDDVYKRFKKLRQSITSEGIILASYIYNFRDIIDEYSNYPINGSNVSYRELLREELLWVDNYNHNKDAVLVLRKY